MIIKSEKANYTIIALIWLAVTAVIALILHLSIYVPEYNFYLRNFNGYKYTTDGQRILVAEEYAQYMAGSYLYFTLLIPIGASVLFFALFFLLTYFCNIIVTDKRAYGKTLFGRNVDLPIDSISAVGSAWFKGISVATSSGRISFVMIKNNKQIHEAIRQLLIERQQKKEQESLKNTPTPQNNAEEIKKYK